MLALAGGGVWAWTAFFSQGPQPAEALPDSTLAYVSIDLDPPGQQKVEAIKTLRKFPAFRDEIGLDTDDDVRKEVFSSLQDEGLCEDVDYADDVEPWLGDRAAFALVDQGKDRPAPVFVVQIKDQDEAEAGLKKLTACASDATGSERRPRRLRLQRRLGGARRDRGDRPGRRRRRRRRQPQRRR